MTREQISRGNTIVKLLDRIDSVLEVDDHEIKVAENGELYQVCKQTLRFKASMQGNDLQLLARSFAKEFLAMLYDKKLQLEEELSKL